MQPRPLSDRTADANVTLEQSGTPRSLQGLEIRSAGFSETSGGIDVSMRPLEVLHGALVFFRPRASAERAQVLATSGFRIQLARVQPVLPAFQFSNHARRTAYRLPMSHFQATFNVTNRENL